MAYLEYVKVWTEFLRDQWAMSLSMTQRGAYLQLFLLAKEHGDTGRIFLRNFPAIGENLGCDGKTCRKILGKFHDDGKILLSVDKNGVVEIFVVNYKHWQELTPNKYGRESLKNRGEIKEKSGKIPVSHRQKQETETEALSACAEVVPFDQIIQDLNEKTKQGYRPTSKATQDKIRARWNEGWRLSDFLYVNSVKAQEWLGMDMAKFLRPETLYGPKFESYRNQKPPEKPKTKEEIEMEESIAASKRRVERTKREMAETFGGE